MVHSWRAPNVRLTASGSFIAWRCVWENVPTIIKWKNAQHVRKAWDNIALHIDPLAWNVVDTVHCVLHFALKAKSFLLLYQIICIPAQGSHILQLTRQLSDISEPPSYDMMKMAELLTSVILSTTVEIESSVMSFIKTWDKGWRSIW